MEKEDEELPDDLLLQLLDGIDENGGDRHDNIGASTVNTTNYTASMMPPPAGPPASRMLSTFTMAPAPTNSASLFPREDENEKSTGRPPTSSIIPPVIQQRQRKQMSLLQAFGNTSAAPSQPFTAPPTCLSPQQSASSTTPSCHHKVDQEAIQSWVYPTNRPKRLYQFNIVQRALFTNTLVCLPTGLGKTFIAAVLMFNYYRWFPEGKIVFMAPTRPLVAQQIEACYNVTGMPQCDTAELTGQQSPEARIQIWEEKRVFFLTPQVMQSDLERGTCPAEQVICCVVDEAHRATGNYAYCEVVRLLSQKNRDFRVLALSATPGSDLKTVQKVITNLQISHIELRTEESMDITQYTHRRRKDVTVVKLGAAIEQIRNQFADKVLGVYVTRLHRMHACWEADPRRVSSYGLITARNRWRMERRRGASQADSNTVEGDFAVAISLYHAYELLLRHGLTPFSRYMTNMLAEIRQSDRRPSSARQQLISNESLTALLEQLSVDMARPLFVGHPKLERLEAAVLEHFTNHEEAGVAAVNAGDSSDRQTRVMIFSEFRDSVEEIATILNRNSPIIRAMPFIGQASKNGKGFSQKEQIQVIKKFQSGGYNVLVATSIGEEGLDIGEVDMIICFDSQSSPIRMLQRMGRTGRKREGRILTLLTEGKEESNYKATQNQYKAVQKAITNQGKSFELWRESPRMIPNGMKHPPCVEQHMEITEYQKPAAVGGRRKSAALDGAAVSESTNSSDLTPSQLADRNFLLGQDIPVMKREAPNLNEKLHWQSQLQPTFQVAHSARSRALVELISLTDRIFGPDGSQRESMQSFETALLDGADKCLLYLAAGRRRTVRECLSDDDNERTKVEHRDGAAKKKRRSQIRDIVPLADLSTELLQPSTQDSDLPEIEWGRTGGKSKALSDKVTKDRPTSVEIDVSLKIATADPSVPKKSKPLHDIAPVVKRKAAQKTPVLKKEWFESTEALTPILNSTRQMNLRHRQNVTAIKPNAIAFESSNFRTPPLQSRVRSDDKTPPLVRDIERWRLVREFRNEIKQLQDEFETGGGNTPLAVRQSDLITGDSGGAEPASTFPVIMEASQRQVDDEEFDEFADGTSLLDIDIDQLIRDAENIERQQQQEQQQKTAGGEKYENPQDDPAVITISDSENAHCENHEIIKMKPQNVKKRSNQFLVQSSPSPDRSCGNPIAPARPSSSPNRMPGQRLKKRAGPRKKKLKNALNLFDTEAYLSDASGESESASGNAKGKRFRRELDEDDDEEALDSLYAQDPELAGFVVNTDDDDDDDDDTDDENRDRERAKIAQTQSFYARIGHSPVFNPNGYKMKFIRRGEQPLSSESEHPAATTSDIYEENSFVVNDSYMSSHAYDQSGSRSLDGTEDEDSLLNEITPVQMKRGRRLIQHTTNRPRLKPLDQLFSPSLNNAIDATDRSDPNYCRATSNSSCSSKLSSPPALANRRLAARRKMVVDDPSQLCQSLPRPPPPGPKRLIIAEDDSFSATQICVPKKESMSTVETVDIADVSLGIDIDALLDVLEATEQNEIIID